MASVQRRIENLERNLNEETKTVPFKDRWHVIHLDDPYAEENVIKIKKRLMETYGTLEGVTFVGTYVPEPHPLPEEHR